MTWGREIEGRGRRASESERVTDVIGEKERERWRWIHILTGVREKWEHITKGERERRERKEERERERKGKNGVTGGSRERIHDEEESRGEEVCRTVRVTEEARETNAEHASRSFLSVTPGMTVSSHRLSVCRSACL